MHIRTYITLLVIGMYVTYRTESMLTTSSGKLFNNVSPLYEREYTIARFRGLWIILCRIGLQT